MTIKITEDNYEEYKRVVEIISGHLYSSVKLQLPAEAQPREVLTNLEKKSKSLAKKSLRMGLTDLASTIGDYPDSLVKAIDNDLAIAGLPNLASIKAAFGNLIGKIIKRNKIRNEEEYYAVKEIVINQASEYSESVRDQLEKIMDDFESKQ